MQVLVEWDATAATDVKDWLIEISVAPQFHVHIPYLLQEVLPTCSVQTIFCLLSTYDGVRTTLKTVYQKSISKQLIATVREKHLLRTKCTLLNKNNMNKFEHRLYFSYISFFLFFSPSSAICIPNFC